MVKLFLLGAPRLEQTNKAKQLTLRKAWGLLAYLVAHEGEAVRRDLLGAMLWPDHSQEQARSYLRNGLWTLKKVLGDDCFDVQRETVTFRQTAVLTTDLLTFQQQLANAKTHARTHPNQSVCPTCVAHLTESAEAYHDAFLTGFSLSDSPEFDAWQLWQRETLQSGLAWVLEQLVDLHSQQGAFQTAVSHAQRLVNLDPFSEPAQRHLMRTLAGVGEWAAAVRQYESCALLLRDELGVEPEAKTTQLYEAIKSRSWSPASLVTVAASHKQEEEKTAVLPPFQAPVLPPHFVGRQAELAELTRLMRGGGAVALVGMGGVGKTTLATQLAHTLQNQFTDGVLWASVALSDPLDILEAWGIAYGYDFSGLADVKNRAAAVRGVLAQKSVLVVLDDVAQAAAVQPLILTGAACRVLLTTRDLDVAHALNARVLPLNDLEPDNAYQLLLDILGEARVAAEAEAAREIGRLLHYLPLAMEIAAQQLRARPRRQLTTMVEQLRLAQNRLDLKISDRAVRASFLVSWEVLTQELRGAFRLLAVFAGRPFSPAALAHLANADLFVAEEWLFGLLALSLVREDGDERYRQHPLLADFAAEQLGEGEKGEINGRFVTYYHQFAQHHHANHAQLRPEWGNIMAAIETAHGQEQWAIVIDFTHLLADMWHKQGRYGQARQAFRLAAEAAQQLGDSEQLANVLLRWGEACLEQNEHQEAQQKLREALLIFGQELEDGAKIAATQYHLARIAFMDTHYSDAWEWLQSTQKIWELLDEPVGLAQTKRQQARVMFVGEVYDRAEGLATEALALLQGSGDVAEQVEVLRLLAQIALKQQRVDEAQGFAEQAQVMNEQLQDQGQMASILYLLSTISRHRHELDKAIEYGENSLHYLRWMGRRRAEGIALHELSMVHRQNGDVQTAVLRDRESLAICRDNEDRLGMAYCLRHLGDLYVELDQTHQAREAWQEAQAMAHALNHRQIEASLQQRIAGL